MAKTCWQFKKCSEEVKESCAAYKEGKGENCWLVGGTNCSNSDSVVDKFNHCRECDYYKSTNIIKNGIRKRLLALFLILLIIPLTTVTGYAVFQIRTHVVAIAENNLNFIADQIVGELTRAGLYQSVATKIVEDVNQSYFTENDIDGYAFVLDDQGVAIIHPTEKGNDLSEHSFVQEMLDNEKGTIDYIWSGEKKFMVYRTLVNGWVLALSCTRADMLTAATNVQNSAIVLGVVFILLGVLVASIFAYRISKPLKAIGADARRIAEGDLTLEMIKVKTKDEIGLLANSFNEMVIGLRDLAMNLLEKSNQIAVSSNQLNASAQQNAAGAGETSTTIYEINKSIEGILEHTQQVAAMTAQTVQMAEEGKQGLLQIGAQMDSIAASTESVNKAITSLDDKSIEITKIVELIASISEQTNLLALNAAIEAARAGEHGRGFAVVADEVRSLAEQSAKAAQEINKIVLDNQAETGQAVMMMTQSTEEVKAGTEIISRVSGSLQEIINGFVKLNERIQQVTDSVQQVSAESENISSLMEEQSAVMQEISASVSMLNQMSEELNSLSRRFKI